MPSDVPAAEVTERSLLNCKVVFGAGASVEHVTTAFDSSLFILSNLPTRVSEQDLIDLIEPFGALARITIEQHSATVAPTARVEMIATEDASRAVEALDGKMWCLVKLAARLNLRAVESGAGTLLSRKVKVSWYAPSVLAWAHYGTIARAKEEAARLDGMMFGTSKLSASFQAPRIRAPRGREDLRVYIRPVLSYSVDKSSYSVEIKGIPLDTSEVNLTRFCHAASVTIGQPSYDRLAAVDAIRKKLLEHGPLDSFEVSADKGRPKIAAFAQFSSPDAAASAAARLHRKPQTFLKDSHLLVEHVHSVKYNIPAPQLTAVYAAFDALREKYAGRCTMRCYDRDETGKQLDTVCVRVYGTDPKSLGRAKVELEALFRGNLLASGGIDVWDEYFGTPEGQSFLQAINTGSQFFVKRDLRTRSLRAFGGHPSDTTQALNLVLAKLQELQSSRHIIPLPPGVLPALLKGGLKSLQDEIGTDAVLLDVVARQLTVRGDSDGIDRVRRTVSMLASSYDPTTIIAVDALCPVCFCEVTEPLRLHCGHLYCRSCLQHLLQSAAGPNFSVLKCVAEVQNDHDNTPAACKTKVPYNIIRDLLAPPDEKRLVEASFLAHVHTRPEEFCYCPTPDCQVIYRPRSSGTVLQCPACLVRICGACNVEFHEGLSCEAHRSNLNGGDEAFRKWSEENGVKPCPNCKAPLQKNGGCNHMTCVQCNTHICWKCMQTFTETDSGRGVYAHMRKVHGGIMN
ncbi:hypothetical protein PLICRDRAFT_300134 [Plicaturopsis crispa FD-325 SS-3]|nr:hypothetical protein PLICRDRAFT_300134 [Plicaturopsis crispa FD-325 SS-3]